MKPVTKRPGLRGFTLLEVLVAIALFSLLSMMAYAGLHSLLQSRSGLQESAAQLQQLQRFFLVLSNDLRQAMPRAVRDPLGTPQAAMRSATGDAENILQFSRNGVYDLQKQHYLQQRVRYFLLDGSLFRESWNVLDISRSTPSRQVRLLDGVRHAMPEFYAEQWYRHWPVSDGLDGQSALPRAVRLTLDMQSGGAVQRVFAVSL